MDNITHISFLMKAFSSKNLCKSEKGATAVEFAIILPLLVLLLFGIIEFGVFMFNKQVITNASREGARAGIISQIPRVTGDQIKDVVDEYCMNHLITFGEPNDPVTNSKAFKKDNTEIDIEDAKFGDTLNVAVTFNYDFLVLPFSQIKMQANTIMIYE